MKAGFQAMNYQISDSAIKDMIAVASDDGDDQVTIEGNQHPPCLIDQE